jgi:hypothetical protein
LLINVLYNLGHAHKKDPAKRKRSRSNSRGLDAKEDLNYVDEDSDLSSGDEVLNLSDNEEPVLDSPSRKRGRPNKEDKKPVIPVPTPDEESDHDESGETKVDTFGKLNGGKEIKEKGKKKEEKVKIRNNKQ